MSEPDPDLLHHHHHEANKNINVDQQLDQQQQQHQQQEQHQQQHQMPIHQMPDLPPLAHNNSDPPPMPGGGPAFHHQQQQQPQMGGDDGVGVGGLDGNMDADGLKDEDGQGQRRFFPRVKQLVNPEWEHFLQGVLHSVQAHQAHATLKASGVEDNAWYQVFHAVYGGFASDSCSVPQGKNRYHKFKDKIVELWRYMAVTEPPDHDVNGRLWKMGRLQWETYKSLLVVAGKNPIEIALDVKGSPTKIKKKGRGKAAATIARGMPLMHYDPPKKNYLPSPLHEIHHIWKMSSKRGDAMEMGFIRKDYLNNVRAFSEDCMSGPETPTKLLWSLEGLNELREIEQDPEIKKIISDAYAQVLQRYLAALQKKRGITKK